MIYGLIFLDVVLLIFWYRYLDRRGKKTQWYWYWIFPSEIIGGVLIVGFGVIATGNYLYNNFPLSGDQTKSEMAAIANCVSGYYLEFGTYPESMKELIGQRPLRQAWLLDEWKTPYLMKTDSGHGMNLISAGADAIFNSQDDIVQHVDGS